MTLDELAAELRQRGAEVRHVTAIAGAPGSGKSTLADALADRLNADDPGSAAVFSMDGYHYDDAVLNGRGWRPRKGAPHTFDLGGFEQMLERLRRNDEAEIAVPVFDRSIEIARNAARFISQDVRHLVVEGNYLLLDAPGWRDLQFDTTVYLDVPLEELTRRLYARWSDLKGEALRVKMEENDLPNVELVVSQSRTAEFVIRNV